MPHLSTMARPSPGWRLSHSGSSRFSATSTKDRTSVLPSLVLVWPSNWGCRTRTATTAVRPSRMSSPTRFSSLSLRSPFSRANSLTARVKAFRKPSSWVPPSWVLMLLAKVRTVSV